MMKEMSEIYVAYCLTPYRASKEAPSDQFCEFQETMRIWGDQPQTFRALTADKHEKWTLYNCYTTHEVLTCKPEQVMLQPKHT